MNLVKFNNSKRLTNPYLGDVFDTFFNNTLGSKYGVSNNPQVNIAETETGFNIELAAPGLDKDDFKVELKNEHLVISAEKKVENSVEQKNYSRKEFDFYTFERSFVLPENINIESIRAEYVNGILQVSIDKKEQAKDIAKQIRVS